MAYDKKKFTEFNRLMSTGAKTVIIHHPEVLGDDYEEIVENLNRLADRGKTLMIVPRKDRVENAEAR